MFDTRLNNIDHISLQFEKRGDCIDTKLDNSYINDQNAQVTNRAKQTDDDYVNESKINNDKHANDSPKKDINVEARKTKITKDSNYIEKDNTDLSLWQKLLICILIVLVVIMAIELYWPGGKKSSENCSHPVVL